MVPPCAEKRRRAWKWPIPAIARAIRMKGGALSHADIADQLQRAREAQATRAGRVRTSPHSTCSASLAGRNHTSQI